MHLRYSLSVALNFAMTACAAKAGHQSAPVFVGASAASSAVVGRWALIAMVRNGEDVTRGGVTQNEPTRYYTFKSDQTFLIQLGDSVTETGTWSTDTTILPKHFDHTPDQNGRPGPLVPGIYQVGGDVLKISFLPPNAGNKRPAQFEATASNGSFLFIMKRVAR
jgi:uncharacterized protein (TIGR03067 family)